MKLQDFLPEAIKVSGPSANVQEWIDKIYKQFPVWPINPNQHVMVWGEQDDPNQQFAVFELVPSMSKKNAVEVKWFQAYPLRQGVGSKAMRELQTLAAKDGISLTLFPWDKGVVSQAALTKFYKRQGFNPMQKGGKVLQWSPEGLDEEILDEYSRVDDEIRTKLEKKGYKYLGGGVDQEAYFEPKTGLVLKIFGTQPGSKGLSNDHKMFFEWADYCMNRPNNPFLPKFSGFEQFIFKKHTYLQIRQERLEEGGLMAEAIEVMAGQIEDTRGLSQSNVMTKLHNKFSELYDQEMADQQTNGDTGGWGNENYWGDVIANFEQLDDELGTAGFKLLLQTMLELYRIGEQKKGAWTFDIHSGNIMMRGNTPVIIDPWVVEDW